jgi:hypothetical protein
MDVGAFVGIAISIFALGLSFITFVRWQKALLTVVAGIAFVEFLALAVSMPIWVRVLIGLVLFAAGVIWVVRANRKVSQQHAEQIRALLGGVGTALKDGRPSNLGKPDADIITRHFPKLAKQVKAWDDAVKGVADSEQALRNSVELRLRALQAEKPAYKFDSVRDGLCAITEARTADGADSAQVFPPMFGNDSEKPIFTFHYDDTVRFVFLAFNDATGVTGDLVRLEGDSYPDGAAREIGDQYGRPIYDLLREMQSWSSPKLLNLNRQKLEEVGASLERAVKKERDKAYYRRVQGCPGCK